MIYALRKRFILTPLSYITAWIESNRMKTPTKELFTDLIVLKHHPETRDKCIVQPKYLPRKERESYQSFRLHNLCKNDLEEIRAGFVASSSPHGQLTATIRTIARVYPQLRQNQLWRKACLDMTQSLEMLPSLFWPRAVEAKRKFQFQLLQDAAVSDAHQSMIFGAWFLDHFIFPRPHGDGSVYLWCSICHRPEFTLSKEMILSSTSFHEAMDLLTKPPVMELPKNTFTRS